MNGGWTYIGKASFAEQVPFEAKAFTIFVSEGKKQNQRWYVLKTFLKMLPWTIFPVVVLSDGFF